jgi:hypothetical protein
MPTGSGTTDDGGRLCQQGLPLPSVLGTNQGFQQIVQVAFDAFPQHEAVIAGEFVSRW